MIVGIWLYRGAWHEWGVEEIEMAVPLSPQELDKKRKAIFMHQSQKDRPPFPGSDDREFWQRAEERNRDTAQGLPRLRVCRIRGDGSLRTLEVLTFPFTIIYISSYTHRFASNADNCQFRGFFMPASSAVLVLLGSASCGSSLFDKRQRQDHENCQRTLYY